MKTTISIPDAVFREAEQFARERRCSRSRLYSEAVAEYLARHASDAVTEEMNWSADHATVEQEGFVSHAARRILRQAEW